METLEQMEVNLDVVFQMASYDPFEILAQQGTHLERASTLKPIQYSRDANLKAKIVEYVLEAL
jgi:hypothetical protein